MSTSAAAPSLTGTQTRQSRAIRRVLWITLLLNVAVAVGKLGMGSITSTLSMVADGYHSLLDGASNIIGLIALSFAHRPPDEDHQYGHRKFEVLASIGISVMLLFAAIEIVSNAWSRFRGTGELAVYSPFSLSVMVVTMGVNIWVSRYEARRGTELHSPFLLADSRHTATDIYASASVIVALLALRVGQTWLDPIAAIVIGGIILHAGYTILKWSLGVLADRAFIDARKIDAIALEFPHVRSTHRVRTRGFSDAVFVDLIVRLDPTLTLLEAHDLCDRLEERLKGAFPAITDIVVHPEPDDTAGTSEPAV